MDVKFWVDLGQSGLMAGLTLGMYFANRRAASKAAVEQRNAQVDRELAELRKEVALAKAGLVAAPDDGDLSRLHERIDAVHGELRHVCGLVAAMRGTVDSISQYLMTREK